MSESTERKALTLDDVFALADVARAGKFLTIEPSPAGCTLRWRASFHREAHEVNTGRPVSVVGEHADGVSPAASLECLAAKLRDKLMRDLDEERAEVDKRAEKLKAILGELP